jgi:hypothetical protein
MATVNITVSNDADFSRSFQFKTDAGVPISIVGGTFEMMLRRHVEDATVMLRLSTDPSGGISIVDGPNGIFNIYIPQATLEQLQPGSFEQSLIMTSGTTKRKIWSGTLTNNVGATR